MRVLIASVLTALLISGCSSQQSVIPQGEYTMRDVYYGSASSVDVGGGKADVRLVTSRPLMANEYNTDAYQLHNSPRAEYQLLPNPTMFLYVKEHLSTADRLPVPAYISEFKFYERDEYALPGEVSMNIGR